MTVRNVLSRFAGNTAGGAAVIVGVSLPMIVMAVGGVTDVARIIEQRQRLANTVELTCKSTTLMLNAEMRKQSDTVVVKKVKGLVTTVLDLLLYKEAIKTSTKTYAEQQGFDPAKVTVTVTTYSDYANIDAKTDVPLYFGKIVGMKTPTININQDCDTIDGTKGPKEPELLFAESFERNHSIAYNGWSVFRNWNGWKTQNAGIEVNGQPALAGNSILFGNYFAELDSHCLVPNEPNCTAQSSMIREFDLEPGDYVMSYWYISRVRNPAYGDQVICGSESDVSWATWEGQTNRINVSFNENSKSEKIIDICVHANKWVERRFDLKVNKAGTYALKFAAAGRSDTYGGLIDYIRFCRNECP